jgi:hypothetical protein
MKRIDLRFVKDTLSELDPTLDHDKRNASYNTALVLLSALVCGPNTGRLAAFTELRTDFVDAIRQRMIQAELWTDSDVLCDHWFVRDNVVSLSAFWSDTLVGEGLVVRRWDEEVGNYRYCAVEFATAGSGGQPKVN